MELLLSPGRCLDSLKLQRVFTIVLARAILCNLVDNAEVEEALFDILFDRTLDLGNQECHQVVVRLLGPILVILLLFCGLIEGALLHVVAMY